MKLKNYLNAELKSPKTDIGALVLRIGLALLMIPHGHDKFYNLIHGAGADFPDPLHVGNQLSMSLTVFAEFICSILLLLGFLTRPAALVLSICMLVIVFFIHGNDPMSDKEHALLYLIPYISLFIMGAGKYSIDAKVFKN